MYKNIPYRESWRQTKVRILEKKHATKLSTSLVRHGDFGFWAFPCQDETCFAECINYLIDSIKNIAN